ncbi:fimbrial protein [Salmonella enterica]|nr:fimbrial protein [Salmonella enterica]EFQ6618144.1 fimbrial protein [Salmonella enterica]
MNITFIGMAIALSLGIATTVEAASTEDAGIITFTGAVSSHTCEITTNNGIDSSNITIDMPVVSVDQVSGATLTSGVGEKEFEIKLTGCDDAITKATVSFSSEQFAELSSGTLKNDPGLSDGAKNVNIALFNNVESNTNQVKIGLPDDAPQSLTLDANHSGTFAYKAAYVPSADMDATNNPVAAGKVSTEATFVVSYQ